MLQGAVDFIGELVARATGAGASRVAALDHEVGDHAVEGHAVVVSALGEVEEIGASDRDLRGEEPGVDVAD